MAPPPWYVLPQYGVEDEIPREAAAEWHPVDGIDPRQGGVAAADFPHRQADGGFVGRRRRFRTRPSVSGQTQPGAEEAMPRLHDAEQVGDFGGVEGRGYGAHLVIIPGGWVPAINATDTTCAMWKAKLSRTLVPNTRQETTWTRR